MSRSKTLPLTLAPKEAYRLFKVTTDLADTLEDIMEVHGSYSPEFLKGLKVSIKQAQTGKLKSLKTLKDLK